MKTKKTDVSRYTWKPDDVKISTDDDRNARYTWKKDDIEITPKDKD